MTTPTDKQIDDLWDEIVGSYKLYDDPSISYHIFREALRRWRTPEPIALDDREPQLIDLDEEECCWWWNEGNECWERFDGDIGGIHNIRIHSEMDNYPHRWTHWVPGWAIKTPKEKEND